MNTFIRQKAEETDRQTNKQCQQGKTVHVITVIVEDLDAEVDDGRDKESAKLGAQSLHSSIANSSDVMYVAVSPKYASWIWANSKYCMHYYYVEHIVECIIRPSHDAACRWMVGLVPSAAVYQRQLSVPSPRGRLMSTSKAGSKRAYHAMH